VTTAPMACIAAALPGFFDRVRDDRLTLISCALERASLEEAYMNIVGEVSHG